MNNPFLKKADACQPRLRSADIRPDVPLTVCTAGESVVLDLGCHYVGYFSFRLWFVDQYIDAPVTLTVRFCETERELTDDYNNYRGWLCRSWLQEDTVNVDFPGEVTLSRRYAARYVRITVQHTPKPLSLSDFTFRAVSSADERALPPLPPTDDEMCAIDRVATRTLQNCMQRVFEDGPKRDRRLWIGDLRLEALANYVTFGNTELVKRCLYLFAAAPRDALGFLPGFVYEDPIYHPGDWFLQDYSLMYVCSVCDLLFATGDTDTFRELLPLCRDILEATHALLDEHGIAVGTDVFIDWCEGLSKTSAFEGVYLYTLDLVCRALATVGEDATVYEARLSDGRLAARTHFFDEDTRTVRSAYDGGQYSVHATAWLILGGVLVGEEAQDVLLRALHDERALQPFTPYMHHYAVEALVKAGALADAEAYIRRIWGGMVALGADTFFEAYVPGDPEFSPYGDRKVNSMCHAWSCTPTYFIRTYGMGRKEQA